MLHTDHIIGTTYSRKGTTEFRTFNPITNQPTPWSFANATPEEASLATQKAAAAFAPFQSLSLKKRATFLRAIASEILALGDPLLEVYCEETGLARGRAEGERARTLFQLETFAQALDKGQYLEAVIDLGDPNRTPQPKVDLRKMNIPIGPIVVFGASNFPLAYSTAGGDTASALACGCPVVVKGHPMHAATGALVASAILKAAQNTEMPEGVFSNLNSNTYELGKQLVLDPAIKGVGFTGSIAGGTALYQLAQSRKVPIPVFAEMGSVNPVVVLPEAIENADSRSQWAKTYAGSITLGSGQFCTNPGLIFCLEGPHTQDFIDQLAMAFSEISPTSMLHPNIHEAYSSGVTEIAAHAKLLAQTAPTAGKHANVGIGAIYEIDGATFQKYPRVHEEVFGPLSVVVRVESEAELHTLIREIDGQLTASVLGKETTIGKYTGIFKALEQRVGRLIFNGVPTGVEVSAAMQHGGPFPASTDARFTAVGESAMRRWLRPISYQNYANEMLPQALQDGNPLKLWRSLNGALSKD